MHASEYQKQAARTLSEKPDFTITDSEVMRVWCALGLVGEAGELAELVKKGILHRHGVDKTELRKELGDVLWYLAAICTQFDIPLSEVMGHNIRKVATRYPKGFTTKDSKKRVDVKK